MRRAGPVDQICYSSVFLIKIRKLGMSPKVWSSNCASKNSAFVLTQSESKERIVWAPSTNESVAQLLLSSLHLKKKKV